MSERPTGTVTFLFSDIEGSTKLLHELGGRYATALEDHRRLLRDAFVRHNGHEVDTQGDAFFVAFARAQDAVRAAADAQRALAQHEWPNGRTLRVRIGVHTSEAAPTADSYVGVGVHRGARICAAAHGGQVLVSQVTSALLAEEDPTVALRDLGLHRLKDLTEPQSLFQLEDEGLQDTFPPIRTLDGRPTNLPIQPTALIGRDREVADLAALLSGDARLVTLTGPGGTGKTRLALQAAAELVDDFPDGVFFVPLAPLTDPDLIVSAISQALGLNEAAGQSFSAYVATKDLLLLLDNFEQIVAGAPKLGELHTRAPRMKLLVTSRESLRMAGEQVFPVPALPVPRPEDDLDTLAQSDAVALFVERARAVQPDFQLTSESAPAIAEICARLDGLPLALELAAARVRLLSPQLMVDRLGERLTLLTAGARDRPVRQQTLRDTLTWSYDLLDADEQQLFARLAVFVDGFTLAAAESICDASLDGVASLVDKSLVRSDGERLSMLETIREYALERLNASSESEEVHARHADHFLQAAEDAYRRRIEREADLAAALETEHGNLRAALDWFRAHDPMGELQLAGALAWFWRVRSHLTEGRQRLASVLARPGERDRFRARASTGAGTLAAWQGDLAAATPSLEEAIAIWRELGEPVEEGLALESLAWGAFFGGDDGTARDAAERSLELMRAHGDPRLVNRAQLVVCQVLVSQGELQRAEQLSQEALVLAEEQEDPWAQHLAYHFLADCALIGEDYGTARERYARALRAAVALGDSAEVAMEMQGVAMADAGRSEPERALRLAAAADARFAALGVDISAVTFWMQLIERDLGRARADVGAERAHELRVEGEQLGLQRAVEEALAA